MLVTLTSTEPRKRNTLIQVLRIELFILQQFQPFGPGRVLLSGSSNPGIDRVQWIELLNLGILLENGWHVVDGRFRWWLQEDQTPLKRRGSRDVHDSLSAGHFCGWNSGGRTGLGDSGCDRAGCAPSSWPGRDQANLPRDVRPPCHGQPSQRLHGWLWGRFIGRFAIFVLATRLALPLRLYLGVYHVRWTETTRLLRLVLALLDLRARERVLSLGEHCLAWFNEWSSRYVHSGGIVQRVFRAIGKRWRPVKYQRPFVKRGATWRVGWSSGSGGSKKFESFVIRLWLIRID